MAQDDNNLSIGDFSIQDTMELGVGNTALLEGLYASESASASPEDISPIVKTVEEDFIPEVARQASKQGGNAPTNSQAFNAESWFKK